MYVFHFGAETPIKVDYEVHFEYKGVNDGIIRKHFSAFTKR